MYNINAPILFQFVNSVNINVDTFFIPFKPRLILIQKLKGVHPEARMFDYFIHWSIL